MFGIQQHVALLGTVPKLWAHPAKQVFVPAIGAGQSHAIPPVGAVIQVLAIAELGPKIQLASPVAPGLTKHSFCPPPVGQLLLQVQLSEHHILGCKTHSCDLNNSSKTHVRTPNEIRNNTAKVIIYGRGLAVSGILCCAIICYLYVA